VLRPALPGGLTVPAGAALAHILTMQAAGLGYRRIAALSGVSSATVVHIRLGRAVQIRPWTEAKILAVRPSVALGQLVKAHHTRRLIRSLRLEGFTGLEIAQRLGLHTRFRAPRPGQAFVTEKTALRVRRLHRLATEGDDVGEGTT
jgi:hypothetical protein